MAGRGKSLEPERNERLRAIVSEIVRKDFGDNKTVAAAKFGISQLLLSEFIAGGRGVGPKLLEGIADHTGYSLDYLYGRTDHPWPATTDDRPLPLFKNLPGWKEADIEARKIFGRKIPDYAFTAAGNTMGLKPPELINAFTVAELARWWVDTASDQQISAALIDKAEREMADEDERELKRIREGKPPSEDHRGVPTKKPQKRKHTHKKS